MELKEACFWIEGKDVAWAWVETMFSSNKTNKPTSSSPTPIALQWYKLYIKQYPARKMIQHLRFLISLRAEIRLKVKDGTHKTSVKVRLFESLTVPWCTNLIVLANYTSRL
jgi:hypothetical protein